MFSVPPSLFFFLLRIIPSSPLHDLFNSRYFHSRGGWGYETTTYTFEGYPFFFLLHIIPPSPLRDLFNSREYFRAIFIHDNNTRGGWGYETTNYTLDHVGRLPQMGSMSRHCDPLQATEMHRLTPLSARLLSSLHSSMLLGPSSSLYLPISLSLSLRRTWIFLFVPLVPRSPLPTAALAPSINAYVRDTMYPAVL